MNTSNQPAIAAYTGRLSRLTDDELHAEGFEVARQMREPWTNELNPISPYRRMILVSAEMEVRDADIHMRPELFTELSTEISTGDVADLQDTLQ